MTQYAYFDSTVAAPSPVIGWYDTGEFDYANLPIAADLFEMTLEQWAGRTVGKWAISNGAMVAYQPPLPLPDWPALAKVALTASDTTVLRCLEHTPPVAVPAEWAAYRTQLRAIISGTAVVTALPQRPAYPSGT